MPEPPPYDSVTQMCNSHTDLAGNTTYTVVDKSQEQQEDEADFAILEAIMARSGNVVMPSETATALKALIRILYRFVKVD